MAQLQAIVNKGAWLFSYHCSIAEVFQFSDLHDPEADDFQNLISSSLSQGTALVKFSRRSDQEFLCEVLTVKQTNRQTDKCQ